MPPQNFWRKLPQTQIDLQNRLWPGETHGADGDCPNPYCHYELTSQDKNDAEWAGGNFTCPNCGWKWNIGLGDYAAESARSSTRSGMSLAEMGKLGEDVVKQYAQEMGGIPGIGQIEWESPTYQDPIDLVAGDYALEVKSLHSESFPRFKIAADPSQEIEGKSMNRSEVIKKKHDRMQELSTHLEKPLYPGVLGVRLNFYTSRADFFFKPEYKDRMMAAMEHIGYTDFSKLNPFKRPEDVTKSTLPAQGETVGDDSDIPF